MPHTNWRSVLDSNPAAYYSFLLSKGYELVYLPEQLQVRYTITDLSRFFLDLSSFRLADPNRGPGRSTRPRIRVHSVDLAGVV